MFHNTRIIRQPPAILEGANLCSQMKTEPLAWAANYWEEAALLSAQPMRYICTASDASPTVGCLHSVWRPTPYLLAVDNSQYI